MARQIATQPESVEAILPTLAIKTDIEKLKGDLTWRIVIAMLIPSAIFAVVVAIFAPVILS